MLFTEDHSHDRSAYAGRWSLHVLFHVRHVEIDRKLDTVCGRYLGVCVRAEQKQHHQAAAQEAKTVGLPLAVTDTFVVPADV